MYVPPQPIEGVRDVTLLFTGRAKSPMRVDEIEIMGPPPSGRPASARRIEPERILTPPPKPQTSQALHHPFLHTIGLASRLPIRVE